MGAMRLTPWKRAGESDMDDSSTTVDASGSDSDPPPKDIQPHAGVNNSSFHPAMFHTKQEQEQEQQQQQQQQQHQHQLPEKEQQQQQHQQPTQPTEAITTTDTTPGPPPDGGLTAWLQIFAGHLVVFNTWGYIISFGIFQPYYQTTLDLPPSTVSWVGSVQTCLVYLVGTFSGRAFDAGYYRHVLALGHLLQIVGIVCTSVSTQYWQLFLSQGVCQGLGCGLVFAPTIANMATWFAKKRVVALGVAACGGATGGIVFPLMARQLLPRIGFAWSVRAMALVVLVSTVMIMLTVRTRLPPRRAGPLVEWAAFKEPTYLLFAISSFFTLWATYFAYYYARSYAVQRLGAPQSASFELLMIINAVGIPGRLIPAYLADQYFGAVTVFIPVIISAATCIFAWMGVNSLTGAYVWVAFFGLPGAAIQSLFPATLAGLTRDLTKNGTRIGMTFTIVSVATLTGPPLAGRLIQTAGGKYIGAQIWGGACMLLGAGFMVAARAANVRSIRMEKESEEA